MRITVNGVAAEVKQCPISKSCRLFAKKACNGKEYHPKCAMANGGVMFRLIGGVKGKETAEEKDTKSE